MFLQADPMECFVVKKILREYKEALGQCVNFKKSSMCFSPNIARDRGAYLQSILNVRVGENFGSYLGLPSIFPRSKMTGFSNIKNKVWKVLLG